MADTGDQIDKRIKFANEAFEFVEHATMKFKTGEWEKKKEILSTLGSNLSLMDKKLSISLENSLVPLKTVSLLSKREIAKVRTAEKARGQREKHSFWLCSYYLAPRGGFEPPT